MLGYYSFADVLVFIAYGLVLLGSGWLFNRRNASTQDYFLGGNKMPMWVVAISVLATSQSAATFLGGPDQGYRGDLTYLATNIGAFIAVGFVAIFLIPKFYQFRVYTVYELLEQRFGAAAKRQAGVMYLFGRIFASGARLYMAAIAVAMILFGDFAASSVIAATLIITLAGLLYTVYGGIRTVIYSDVLQAVIYVSAAIAVIIVLYNAIPIGFSELVSALQNPAPGAPSKLQLIDTEMDFSSAGVFNIWSVLTGFVLLNIAAFGLDQDMTQRVLTCKNAKEGSKAMLMSVVMVIPVMLLFIVIGLLLYIYYQRPDIMASGQGDGPVPTFAGEAVTIFMYYVLTEIPAGVRGLVTIGIIAAALSTLNSGLNSMSSVLIQDIYRPWKLRRRADASEKHFVRAGQLGMTLVAAALALMACLCYYWQQYTDTPLLQFALSVMVFSYSGLLGVYFVTLFSKRGSPASVAAALVIGFIVPLLMQPYVMDAIWPTAWVTDIGFTWQLMIGTAISTLICLTGSSAKEANGNERNV
ncbi:sodium:solute symporter [Pseudidiomarina terrestris]|uniref:Sodium:solute symporter n=1 Tax=Pseudidiomarina terrestris TaxID=2820060 RepID=A0AAW7R544_9GAMM|nr:MULTISPECIES: sodium:solute symporter [unclassified Pseudidiomarina]MDN7125644.1 sodium:solute symporter [Pseudidiomarina sp. 1APP75-32.1]MDN7126106.1 sodium:solute symporter [Pseudidiomarina sp. 1APR75-33.1]MDN7130492.1 sodium:solute symporter [Pseudidiomarina sp. 1APR75-15]MDN7134134.1 sodium:solute symporter [Pseudidiomarina sp. 1ASP75-5]MDN7137179.1 sodium:solute symporter [Pseudidiomarina sp. 1ASP75-14]